MGNIAFDSGAQPGGLTLRVLGHGSISLWVVSARGADAAPTGRRKSDQAHRPQYKIRNPTLGRAARGGSGSPWYGSAHGWPMRPTVFCTLFGSEKMMCDSVFAWFSAHR